jgi:hypothetical protein
VFAVNRHLDDSALVRRYLAERGLEVLDQRDESLLKHLGQCQGCQTRYSELVAALDESRDMAIDQADAAFTPERLAVQHERIMRRVEAQAGARILSFPAVAQAASRSLRAARPTLRWVAAAAVTGLMIGVAAGQYMNIFERGFGGFTSRTRSAQSAHAAPRSTPVMQPVGTQRPHVDEDEFLSEVDGAITEPRTSELSAIYTLTLQHSDGPRLMQAKY